MKEQLECQDEEKVSKFVNYCDTSTETLDATFEYRYHKQSCEGFTLLFYAVIYDQVDMMKLLIKHGAGMWEWFTLIWC